MADISVSSPGVGPWIPLELPEPVETLPAGNDEARVRLEPAGIVRMTGMVRVRVGHTVKEGELLATLPLAVREKRTKVIRLPVATFNQESRGVLPLQIETTNGQITILGLGLFPGLQLLAGEQAFLECSYSVS